MATPTATRVQITVTVNGQSQTYPVKTGRTANDLIGDAGFLDLFQVPRNVEPVVNGVLGQGHVALQTSDVLSFQTRASSKARKARKDRK